jgi:hypothetical protein
MVTKWPTIQKSDKSYGFQNKMADFTIWKQDTIQKMTIRKPDSPDFRCWLQSDIQFGIPYVYQKLLQRN